MQTSLLSSLRKYSPREKTDPLENFLTEAFAWLLNNHTDFGGYFIDQISSRISIDSIKDGNGEWETQCNFDGVFPDMVYTWRNSALVFEHKTWSSLHKNQLQNYRDYASENFSESWIVLITANKQQHSQSPDLALCWDEVYQIIKYWISSNESASFIFEDFLGLLKEEGMGPPAPISHESILYYFTAKKLENSVIQLMQRVENSGWIPDVNRNEVSLHVSRKDGKAFKEQWGRVGFNYFSWKPALFVGIMLDGKDHSVTASNKNQGPDFCLI